MAIRLIVVAGPGKGATYFLKEGQNILGRSQDADIILEHSQVSKRHCIINCGADSAEVLDAGSSNGTYLNGVLVKRKKMKVKDRLSIGPFVLEIIVGASANKSLVSGQQGDFSLSASNAPVQVDAILGQTTSLRSEREKSFFKKLFYKFDEVVPPVVIDMNTRHEWWVIVSGLFLIYVFFYIGLSVYPLLETAKESVLREAERRAYYIARQIADINQQALANGQEALLNVDFAEKDQSVVEALIVDLAGRILAPGARVNETANNPFIVKQLNMIREGNQKAWRLQSIRNEDATKVMVTVPIFVRAPKSGLNVPKAIVSVTFLLKGITLDSGTIGVVYFESLIIGLILGVFFVYIVFRLTNNAIRVTNDEMDNVLKGNQPSVNKHYKFASLDQLIDSINSTLSRIPNLKVDEKQQAATTDNEQQIIDSFLSGICSLVTKSSSPVLVLSVDGKVLSMNSSFEEMSGIHFDTAVQQPISDVSRDEAFAAMMMDMMHKAPALGVSGAFEDYEFTTGLHKVHCYAVFSMPEKVEAFVVFVERPENEDN